MKLVIACLAMLGVLLIPAGTSQADTLWTDSETASEVSDWLRNLEVPTSETDHVIEPMLPYHFQAILSGAVKDQIHSLGMSQVYTNASVVETMQSALQAEYEVRSPILQASGMALARDLTAAGFWEIHEPIQNFFHYELSDIEMDSAATYGIQNLVTIQPYALYDQYTAGYSSNSNNDSIYNGGDYFVLKDNTGPGAVYSLTNYQNFLSNLASQYPQVEFYEVGNEVDGADSAYANNGAGYAALTAASRATLGDDVTLLNAGAIDIRFSFWSDFFAAGGGDDLDVFNIHYNLEKAGIESDFSVYQNSLDGYNDVLDTAGVDLPIWITEMGTFADGTSQTEEEQAAWHVKYFAFGAARGVTKFFLDMFGNNTEPLGQSAMMYQETGSDEWTARLLLYTAKLMNQKLSGFTECKELVEGEQYEFTVNGEPVYVLWGDDDLPSELADKTVNVTDLYGNVTTTKNPTLSDLPVFITTPPKASVSVPPVSTNQTNTKSFTVSWSGGDFSGSGVASYDVWYTVGKGDWTLWLDDTPSTQHTFTGKSGKQYTFKVKATDNNGNTGKFSNTDTIFVPFDDAVLSYADGWVKTRNTKAFLKILHTAKQAELTAQLDFSSQYLYLVGTKGPEQGKVYIYIDGALVKKIDLQAEKTKYHQVLWHKQFTQKKQRSLKIKTVTNSAVSIDGVAY